MIGDHLRHLRFGIPLCPGYSRSTIGVDGGSLGGLYEPGDACVAPTQIYRTHRAWTLSIGTRFVPLRGIVIICAIYGSVFPVSGVFAVDHRGRWSFTWRSLPTGRRMRRPYTDLSNPSRVDASHWYPFRSSAGGHRHNRRHLRFSGEGDSHHLGGDHLGVVSGAFPVNNRGRWWFTWRSLPTGRRRRRPYTDLSTPARVGCTRRRPFRSSGWGTVEKGTVWFKRPPITGLHWYDLYNMYKLYNLELTRSAQKDLRRLDRPVRVRVVDAIELLVVDPYRRGVRQLDSGIFRYRVGHYRIIYNVDQDTVVVRIVRVRHRSQAYQEKK